MDADDGDRLHQVRLKGARITGNSRFGSLDYASPVVVGDRLFYLNASGQMYVFGLGDEPRQLAVNEVTTDQEIFWGSPAVSDGRIVLRSSKHLYCVADKGGKVDPHAAAASKVDVANSNASAQPSAEAGQRGYRRGSRTSAVDNENRANDPRPNRPQRPLPAEPLIVP